MTMSLAEQPTTHADPITDAEKCCSGGLCTCLAACSCDCPGCVC